MGARSTGVGLLSHGSYIAPAQVTAYQLVKIIARDPARSQTTHATVTLHPALRVILANVDLTSRQQVQFNVEPAETVTWMLEKPEVGRISESGVYMAPECICVQKSVVVTAKSQVSTSRSASAAIKLQVRDAPYARVIFPWYGILLTLVLIWLAIRMWGALYTPPNLPQVVVSPSIATLGPGATQVFTATMPSSPDEAKATYTWSGPDGESLVDGSYKAPLETSLSSWPQAKIITARRSDDPAKAGAATVILSGSKEIALQIVPASALARSGQIVPFNVILGGGTGSGAGSVIWKLPPDAGVVSPDGLYRAPSSVDRLRTFSILAQSKSDQRIQAAASEQCFSESKAPVPTNISRSSIASARVTRCASRCLGR